MPKVELIVLSRLFELSRLAMQGGWASGTGMAASERGQADILELPGVVRLVAGVMRRGALLDDPAAAGRSERLNRKV